jgi:hypothetical protein
MDKMMTLNQVSAFQHVNIKLFISLPEMNFIF